MFAYKFIGTQYGLDDIAKKRIKISQFSDMNDPFELLGARFSDARVAKIVLPYFNNTKGALCLSRNCFDPVLWSHYADKHKGMCLEFELAESVPTSEARYIDRPSEANAKDLIRALETNTMNMEGDWLPVWNVVFGPLLLTKFSNWKYEDEVRIITSLDEQQDGMFFYDFTAEFRLKGVILGARSASSLEGEVRGALIAYSSPIEIRKGRLSTELFQIEADVIGVIGGQCAEE
jgi:hypothetical protein